MIFLSNVFCQDVTVLDDVEVGDFVKPEKALKYIHLDTIGELLSSNPFKLNDVEAIKVEYTLIIEGELVEKRNLILSKEELFLKKWEAQTKLYSSYNITNTGNIGSKIERIIIILDDNKTLCLNYKNFRDEEIIVTDKMDLTSIIINTLRSVKEKANNNE